MSIVYLRSNPINPDPRVEKEVNSLIKLGHKVLILAWDRSGDLVERGSLSFQFGSCSILRYRGRAKFGGGMRSLPALIKFQFFLLYNLVRFRKTYNVVHAADFDTVLPAMIVKVLFRKKLIYDVFDFYVDAFLVPNLLTSFIRRIDLLVMQHADGVIITNEERLAQIAPAKPKRLVVIHNTPDLSSMTEPSLLSAENLYNFDIRVAYVGILQPDRLIEEVLQVFSRNQNWCLDIAGFGSLETTVEKYARSFDNIKFHGRVSYSDAMKINRASDILFATYNPIIANHKYSSPNKLYEAMLLSKPLIVCNSTGVDRLVLDEGIGFSINYSGADFEKCILSILENKVDLRHIGLRSRKLYDEGYSWAKMEDVLYGLYKNVLSEQA